MPQPGTGEHFLLNFNFLAKGKAAAPAFTAGGARALAFVRRLPRRRQRLPRRTFHDKFLLNQCSIDMWGCQYRRGKICGRGAAAAGLKNCTKKDARPQKGYTKRRKCKIYIDNAGFMQHTGKVTG